MSSCRVLLATLFLTFACKAEWTQGQKEWALGTSGILTQMANSRHDLLFGTEQTPLNQSIALGLLKRSWGIHDRDELLRTIRVLLEENPDRTRLDWNYCRAVNLARWGYGAAFLTEREAWDFIVPAAVRLQQTFSSWQDLGEVYLAARRQWFTDIPDERRRAEWAYRTLMTDPASPWRLHPWNFDLGGEQPVLPSFVKTAWLELAAHAQGLICVRLSVPDRRSEESYEAAIEQAVGCKPRVTGERRNGPDWILDTECVNPRAQQGAQVVAHVQLEPIAKQLRREGITQVFTYVEHVPHGSSEISPAAYDSWLQNGYRFYVDTRSLDEPLPDTTLIFGLPPREVRIFLIAARYFVAASLIAAWAIHLWSVEAVLFPALYWGGWLFLSVSFHGLAITGFWTGNEGFGANVLALSWYGTAALLLRVLTDLIMSWPKLRSAVPEFSLPRALEVSFWRGLSEIPFAIVLVLLCDPENPLGLGTLIALLGLGAATAFVSWHFLMLTLGVKGGLAKAGELYDAVFQIAARMKVPLRRLYILPEGSSPRVAPLIGSKGDLMIPERLVRLANRREIDGVVAYELMLIKDQYVTAIWRAIIPTLLLAVWRAYLYQTSPSESFTLLRELGIFVYAFVAFQKCLRKIHSGAEKAFCKAGGDAEGWIAGLARIARLAGSTISPGILNGIARRCGIPQDRVPLLAEAGLPASGQYPIPDFARDKLVPVS